MTTTCNPENTVDQSSVNRDRMDLVTGGPAIFADGTPIQPHSELLVYLQAAADLEATVKRVDTVPNVLAFMVAIGNRMPKFVVQYPTSDYPNDDENCIEYAVVSFSGPWPCMHCYVTDGGTLTVWPDEVNAPSNDPYGPTDKVCLTHRTVERVPYEDDGEDEDESDLDDEAEYY